MAECFESWLVILGTGPAGRGIFTVGVTTRRSGVLVWNNEKPYLYLHFGSLRKPVRAFNAELANFDSGFTRNVPKTGLVWNIYTMGTGPTGRGIFARIYHIQLVFRLCMGKQWCKSRVKSRQSPKDTLVWGSQRSRHSLDFKCVPVKLLWTCSK